VTQWLDMKQKVAFSDQPALAIRRQGKCRHQIVDVGMVAQVARPGLQGAEHANLPTQEPRVLGQLLERGRGRVKRKPAALASDARLPQPDRRSTATLRSSMSNWAAAPARLR
jgi:hypothetical protein